MQKERIRTWIPRGTRQQKSEGKRVMGQPRTRQVLKDIKKIGKKELQKKRLWEEEDFSSTELYKLKKI
jgi:hypothetical protein